MDIIIAHYNEKLDSVLRELNALSDARIYVYSKGEAPAAPDNILIIKRPNIGREAETYLYHIIENYDTLADTTMFIQGNPMDHATSLGVSGPACRATGFYPLNPKRTVVEHYDDILRPETFYLPVFRKTGLRRVEFPAGAQFVVSKERILQRPRAFYEELHRQLHIGPELSHFDAELYRRPDYNHDRIDPWILERLWPSIFGAAGLDAEIAIFN